MGGSVTNFKNIFMDNTHHKFNVQAIVTRPVTEVMITNFACCRVLEICARNTLLKHVIVTNLNACL